MKIYYNWFIAVLVACLAAVVSQAQVQPVVAVDIRSVAVFTGSGSVVYYTVTNSGGGYDNGAVVAVSGPGGGGVRATATAVVASGVVTGIIVNNPGSGYVTVPTVTISPRAPGGGAAATATASLGTFFGAPFSSQNESYGPAGTQIGISALAVGTNPVGGFIYTFYVNGQTIGALTPNPQNGSPGTIGWTPPQPGAYFLTVKVDDGISGPVTSLAVRYFATGTSIVSPVDHSLVPNGSSMVIQAVATPQPLGNSNNAFVQRIDFYADGLLIGSDTTYPYSIIYTPASAPATHSIEARAFDNLGNQISPNGTAVEQLTMVAPVGTPPTSSINSPLNNAALAIPDYVANANASITVAVDAFSPNGVINKVELYIDGVLFSTKTTYPYTFSWKPQVVGVYHFVALAYDDKNNVVASTTSVTPTATPAPTTVTVAAAPTVVITSPTAGANVAGGSSLSVTATASNSNGNAIVSVQFFDNGTFVGEATLPNSGTASSYSISYTPTPKKNPDGSPIPSVLTALAIDSLGLSKLSAGVALNVTTGGVPPPPPVVGIPPTVTLTAPIASSQVTIGGTVTLTATANDPDGNITNVQFLVNGLSVGTDAVYPYAAVWTPTSLGVYTISAKATDNDANTVTSSPVSVTVIDPSPGAPAISITGPTAGALLTVGNQTTIQATATDDVAIANVQFYINGQPVGTVVTTFPYTFAWTPGSPGSYSLVARATDNVGNQTSSAPVVVTVGSGGAPTISMTSPANGSSIALGGGLQINTTANDSDGTIAQVQIYANGILIPHGTLTTAPYNLNWVPGAAGNYALTAIATDNTGNTTATPPVNVSVTSSSAPGIVISSPGIGAAYGVGTSVPFTATVTAAAGTSISQVQFYVDGILIGSDLLAPYAMNWVPPAAGTYILTASATNSAAITAVSAPVTLTISGGSAPTVAITSPTAGTSVGAGTIVNLAATASAANGAITSVRFLANGFVVGTATVSPFLTSWSPSAAGTYSLVAQATDNAGNVTASAPVTLTVTGNAAPTVSVTSPRSGASLAVGATTTVTAAASDPDGTIASVQFYANNVSLGVDTVAPYSATWSPSAEGMYRITAVAIDNSGAAVTSPAVVVLAAVAGAGSIDTVASGLFIDGKNFSSGQFTAINLHNRSTTFIAYVPASQTQTPAKTWYFSNVPTDGSGNFELTDSSGAVLITGQFSASGVSGSFADGTNNIPFSGINGISSGTASVGYYQGSVSGSHNSLLTGIVGLDGRITVYVQDGALADAGSTTLDASGGFTLRTRAGNRLVGTADPVTGLLTGTLTKAGSTAPSSFTGAQGSGTTFSDGSLRNISSRVLVGTGDRVLIAGFVVSGSSPKTVLIRATGPALAGYGVAGALADPALFLFNQSGLQIATNDNWGTGGAAVSTAAAQVGAFPLAAGSLDASLILTLTPGVYSAQVSGVGGTTGIALLELYDVDTVGAYSGEKMVNLSTRGQVGTGSNIMIAGFVVSGTSAKKVLIRGVGPALAAAGVTGALADPFLRIVRQDGVIIRENDNWSVGNDVNLVADAASKIGAFPLPAGSKDAVILINLPPGTYNAQLSGADGGTGIGLIEVYEVQ
jgi:hypothetical protein